MCDCVVLACCGACALALFVAGLYLVRILYSDLISNHFWINLFHLNSYFSDIRNNLNYASGSSKVRHCGPSSPDHRGFIIVPESMHCNWRLFHISHGYGTHWTTKREKDTDCGEFGYNFQLQLQSNNLVI